MAERLVGLEYHESRQKQVFDRIAATALLIPLGGVLLPIVYANNRLIGIPTTWRQERMGKGGDSIQVEKILTFNPRHVNESVEFPDRQLPPASPFLKLVARSGLDETPQLFAVIAGSMSIVGPRPYPQASFGKLFESFDQAIVCKWIELLKLTKPGVIGMGPASIENNFLELVGVTENYVYKGSIAWDLKAFLHTFNIVLRAKHQRTG